MSKASALAKLRAEGMRVPPFVVVPAAIFTAFQATLAEPGKARGFLEAALPPDVEAGILSQAGALDGALLAVRSSMAGEDSEKHSFAGQLDSILRVANSKAAVLAAVRRCWASAVGPRASAYREQHGLDPRDLKMEVILQVMIEAEASGILFTADPAKRDPAWMVISVARGLGDALAQGEEAGETVRFQRASGAFEGEQALLNRGQVEELCATALRIETLFGQPQDIEFCFKNGELFILQARPITTDLHAERILWDNSNITESYSGVTSPMTFSIIRGAYARVYRDFLAMMGARRVEPTVLQHLLGLYDGQVYYQLLNWYETLRALPAFEQNRPLLDQMMGVKQPAPAATGSSRGGRLALAGWVIRMIGLHLTGQRRVDEFQARFTRIYGERRGLDLSALNPQQLLTEYRYLETAVLGNWRAPILTDFMAMIFFGALRRVCERWFGADGSVHNDLLASDGKIESMDPVRQVAELAQMVRAQKRLRELFHHEAAEVLQVIQTQDELAGFRGALQSYLNQYGDRCMNELKLEEPNLRDDPLPLIRWIAAAAATEPDDGSHRPIRAMAEAKLKGLPLAKRVLVGWLLANTRRHVRNRENMRFARSRLYGMLRGILNALGGQWFEHGLLKSAHDIYYLTIEEVFDYVHGTAVTQNLAGLAEFRRQEYEAHRAGGLLPNRFETFGTPYADAPEDLLPRAADDEWTLHGTGCCSGVVRGEARLVTGTGSTASIEGRILVAERTDPGWIFLFPSATGILVERGSPLSHSAIVAREMGKPIIVNIPRLTSRVKDGERLEMDGQLGIVHILRP